eukprot:TRINITY_DN117858_c0_g1_i1.p1 TRINITY_DN117858_c0_g1~~TRINITY_DN117858_c0_g1_i1.p1  ORF type:complete len:109 (-),score=6.68 TRINITY_DN117858_c0_g1_i1:76-402(-)
MSRDTGYNYSSNCGQHVNSMPLGERCHMFVDTAKSELQIKQALPLKVDSSSNSKLDNHQKLRLKAMFFRSQARLSHCELELKLDLDCCSIRDLSRVRYVCRSCPSSLT